MKHKSSAASVNEKKYVLSKPDKRTFKNRTVRSLVSSGVKRGGQRAVSVKRRSSISRREQEKPQRDRALNRRSFSKLAKGEKLLSKLESVKASVRRSSTSSRKSFTDKPRKANQVPNSFKEVAAEEVSSLEFDEQDVAEDARDSKSHLWYDHEFPLSERYPIESRFSLRKSFGWLVGTIALLLVYLVYYGLNGLAQVSDPVQMVALLVIRVMAAAFLIQLARWELFRLNFHYRIDGFRLVIEKGIIYKTEGSLPLIPVTEIYVKRDPLDTLFGLAQLQIVLPIAREKNFSVISGLSYLNALRFEEYLSEQLSNQIFLPDEVKASN